MKKVLFGLLSISIPSLSLAAVKNGIDLSYFANLISSFNWLLNLAVTLLIALSVVWFIWNVFGYIRSANDDDKKQHVAGMIWGIVGIAVIVSVWGLVSLLQSSFGIRSQGAQTVQLVPVI